MAMLLQLLDGINNHCRECKIQLTFRVDCLFASFLGETHVSEELRINTLQRNLLLSLWLVNAVTMVFAI